MKDIKNVEKYHKALANRRRLSILVYLAARQEASVGAIAEAIKLSFKATSRHLSILASADILEREQTSTTVLYRFVKPLSPIIKTTLEIL